MGTSPVVIENPVINSPFDEPRRHFRFSDEGITNEIVAERRTSSYFIPIAAPKKKGKEQYFETEWTQDRIEENKFINQVRSRIKQWRENKHFGVSRTTAQLLQYWTRPDRERRLFFCQIEALETLIYLTEVAKQQGDTWIENQLHAANADANPLLYRAACKMATGSGKTVVMAMLIAWQTLNKLANAQDARFTDSFLIVTPGITIRDRLRVLMPNDAGNYYRLLDIVPPDLMPELGKAKIVITNFHAFQLREHTSAGKLTKSLLQEKGGAPSPFTETPDQMVRRVCREFGTKKNILVINDEAHHCYRRRVGGEEVKLVGDERKEAEKREEEARIWISGLEAVKAKIGVKVVYDLSATPFFLRGFDSEVQSWRFPRLLEITREWLSTCVRCKDNTFPQLLLLLQFAHDATDKIYKAIVASTQGEKALKPILRPYDTIGSTQHVDFDTTKATYTTRADRCHVSHVVADTESWEQKLAQTLEDMPEVFAYVKNQNLGFTIPYTLNGEEHNYYPDFIVLIDDGYASSPAPPLGERVGVRGRSHEATDYLHLILECTGQKKKDKEAKVTTAQTLWIPAVNGHGEFGRWAFLEIDDPWDAKNFIRAALERLKRNDGETTRQGHKA